MEFENVVVPDRIKLLVVSDIDLTSSIGLAEKFVPHKPQFDACLVCGSFLSSRADATPKETESPEDSAIMAGDIASAIAQLENIVCRVIYIAGELDPISILAEQPHLTPNSININARTMPLLPKLQIAGFTETDISLANRDVVNADDRDNDAAEVQDMIESVDCKSSSSIDVLHDMLDSMSTGHSSIFLLNYKFTHTLNHFLFHSTERLQQAQVFLCVVPSSSECSERLPTAMGKIRFCVAKSLRDGGNYAIADIEVHNGNWSVLNIEEYKI